MTSQWISEGQALPKPGQKVLVMVPRMNDRVWDVMVASITMHDEHSHPYPVPAGSVWPTDFWWTDGHEIRDRQVVTGNGYWTSLSTLLLGADLPPGAEMQSIDGFTVVGQIGDRFVREGQNQKETRYVPEHPSPRSAE